MSYISPDTCRAARALIDWTRKDLASAASVAERTVASFERGDRIAYQDTQERLRAALESAGVVFLAVGSIEGVGIERKP
ncbi:MAG: multiprotein-bridging factor 1 family protein [Sphingomonadales bacterium]